MNTFRCELLLMLITVIGCGGDKAVLPTAPVAGTVIYRGKPLSSGRVIFLHKSGQAAAADLNTDGSFKLVAFQGENQVAIECLVEEPRHSDGSPRKSPFRSLIPSRYADFHTSGLTFEVTPGENRKAEFVLKD